MGKIIKTMVYHFKDIKIHLEDLQWQTAMTSSRVSVRVFPDDCGLSSWCYSDNNALQHNIDSRVKHSRVEELMYVKKKMTSTTYTFYTIYTFFFHTLHYQYYCTIYTITTTQRFTVFNSSGGCKTPWSKARDTARHRKSLAHPRIFKVKIEIHQVSLRG